MKTIRIDQIATHEHEWEGRKLKVGDVYRIFHRYADDARELDRQLREIALAYDLSATRVYVDGVEYHWNTEWAALMPLASPPLSQ